MGNSEYKIAVVSDLHCKYSGGALPSTANSFLLTDTLRKPVSRHPVEALKKLITENQITVDAIVCPGDITDKCDKQGLISGWEYLRELKPALNTSLLLSTVGNHDVDSRKIHSSDSFDLIKRISEEYPTPDQNCNLSYWAKHYCIFQQDNFCYFILNSCFSHTDASSAVKSFISGTMLEEIENDLKKLKRDLIFRIALIHHHPIEHSNLDYHDEDLIDKSDKLIQLLEKYNFNICIHGHKHDPRLTYKGKVPVLAAGSFSSTMNIVDLKADNVFHIIKLNTTGGKIESWIYSPRVGWEQKYDTYFPCHTGFGFRGDLEKLVDECGNWLINSKKEYLLFSDLIKQYPTLENLIPDDQIRFGEIMLEKFKFCFNPSLPNKPLNIIKLHT